MERKIAELLGGVRIPITGRIRGNVPDIQHDIFSIEVKHKQTLPDWIHDAMNQAEQSRRGEQIPLVVLHQKGQKFDQSFTIMRLCDTIEMMRKIKELEDKVESLKDDIIAIEAGIDY